MRGRCQVSFTPTLVRGPWQPLQIDNLIVLAKPLKKGGTDTRGLVASRLITHSKTNELGTTNYLTKINVQSAFPQCRFQREDD